MEEEVRLAFCAFCERGIVLGMQSVRVGCLKNGLIKSKVFDYTILLIAFITFSSKHGNSERARKR